MAAIKRLKGAVGMHRLIRTGWAGAALALAGCATGPQPRDAAAPAATVWRFDDLHRIGGAAVRVEGDPQLIATPAGPAVSFDGVDDALFIESHPLAGARKFTIEAIFRPAGGAFEQRWMHLAEATGDVPADTWPPVPASGPRMLFEIRVVGDRWYLDAFTTGPGYNKTLIVPEKTYPLNRWYHVAQVYDGHSYRSYVDGELQAEAVVPFQPQGQGYASLGTRINRRDYFNGAVLSVRFTPGALTPGQFMSKPDFD